MNSKLKPKQSKHTPTFPTHCIHAGSQVCYCSVSESTGIFVCLFIFFKLDWINYWSIWQHLQTSDNFTFNVGPQNTPTRCTFRERKKSKTGVPKHEVIRSKIHCLFKIKLRVLLPLDGTQLTLNDTIKNAVLDFSRLIIYYAFLKDHKSTIFTTT